MKTTKILLAVLFAGLLIVAFGVVMAKVKIARRQQAEAASREYTTRQKALRAAELDRLANQSQPPAEPALPPTVPVAAETQPAVPAMETNSQPRARPPVVQAPAPAPRRRELQDPLARIALGMVGQDRVAEEYWIGAIFDPSIPDAEREDLMEDLNEEGLSNPRRPAPEDFPLIASRIALIEQVAPQADAFMMEHLWEAYKDLWNLMYGRPPQ